MPFLPDLLEAFGEENASWEWQTRPGRLRAEPKREDIACRTATPYQLSLFGCDHLTLTTFQHVSVQ